MRTDRRETGGRLRALVWLGMALVLCGMLGCEEESSDSEAEAPRDTTPRGVCEHLLEIAPDADGERDEASDEAFLETCEDGLGLERAQASDEAWETFANCVHDADAMPAIAECRSLEEATETAPRKILSADEICARMAALDTASENCAAEMSAVRESMPRTQWAELSACVVGASDADAIQACLSSPR